MLFRVLGMIENEACEVVPLDPEVISLFLFFFSNGRTENITMTLI